jgi:GH35 family endo-1,4-beta-xylanase
MQFVKALTEKGAKPDGIGIEGHFSSDYNPFTLETAEKNLKELASLGLPLKITELDFPRSSFLGSEDPEQKRATYLKEMLTLFYGTPQIEGIYFWGFADPVHWKGNEGAGLFDSELKIKIAGEEFQKLTQEEWVTKETKTAEDNGIINFRGFPGRYQIIDQASGRKVKEVVLEEAP